jgi:hypothetical protein
VADGDADEIERENLFQQRSKLLQPRAAAISTQRGVMAAAADCFIAHLLSGRKM